MELAIFDYVALGLVGLSLVVGLWRGLLLEFIAFFAFVVFIPSHTPGVDYATPGV